MSVYYPSGANDDITGHSRIVPLSLGDPIEVANLSNWPQPTLSICSVPNSSGILVHHFRVTFMLS